MDSMIVLIAILFALCVGLFIKQKLDERKLAAFAKRLGAHGILVFPAKGGCTYCRGDLVRLMRRVPTEPPPGAKDLGLTHLVDMAIFCTKCGVDKPRSEVGGKKLCNLFAYMDELDNAKDR